VSLDIHTLELFPRSFHPGIQFRHLVCPLWWFTHLVLNQIPRDKWARTQSPNPDIKVYLGAPGSSKAAGNGYVDIQTLSKIAKDAQDRYSSFGGVMLWDADVAYSKLHMFLLFISSNLPPDSANNRYDRAIKNALTSGPSRPNPPSGRPTATLAEPAASTESSLPELKLPDDFKDPRKTT
jgi:chitinase